MLYCWWMDLATSIEPGMRCPICAPNAEPTGALYGFISMLRRLRTEYPAQYSACIFDAKGKTFREDLYPAYKAHRPAMPAELALQIEPIRAAVRALGWP